MFEERGNQLIRKSGGGGCAFLFGLPFMLAGGAIFTGGVLSLVQGKLEMIVPMLFGVPFFLVGAAVSLGRSGWIIDRSRRTAETWWGFLVPMWRTEHNLSTLRKVSFTKETRGSGKNRHTVYPVYFDLDGKNVEMESPNNFLEARRNGEKYAQFLQVPLADKTGAEEVVRNHDELDLSFRERMLGREDIELPAEPDPTGCGRIKFACDAGVGAFMLPKGGFNILHYVGIGFCGLFLVGGLLSALPVIVLSLSRGGRDLVEILFMLLFAVPFSVVPGIIIYVLVKSATTEEKVLVSPDFVKIERTSRFGATSVHLKSEEIEEVLLSRKSVGGGNDFSLDHHRIYFMTDETVESIGAGMKPAEKEWLFNAVQFYLLAEPEL